MKVKAHFVKTTDFRTIQASGVFGGIIRDDGLINMTFFTERPPLPKTLILDFDETTNALKSQEISEDSKTGIIREVSFGINMDMTTAKQVADWLNQQISAFEQSKIKDLP